MKDTFHTEGERTPGALTVDTLGPRVWFRLARAVAGVDDNGKALTFPDGCPVRIYGFMANREGEIQSLTMQDPIGRILKVTEPTADIVRRL